MTDTFYFACEVCGAPYPVAPTPICPCCVDLRAGVVDLICARGTAAHQVGDEAEIDLFYKMLRTFLLEAQ